MKKIKKNKTNILSFFIMLLSLIIIITVFYVNKYFDGISFSQIIFSMNNAKGTSLGALSDGILFVSGFSLLLYCFLVIIILLINNIKTSYVFVIKYKRKKISFNLLKISSIKCLFLSVFLFIGALIYSINTLSITDYISYNMTSSSFIEDNYVDSKKVNITFSEKKRNLIYIYLESMENSNLSYENGGLQDISYTPNLERLVLNNNNINFSNSDLIGGALDTQMTNWTVAAMVAQTSGLPLKMNIDYTRYSESGQFLPGAYSLGNILEKNGFHNYIMMGSSASYAGRSDYFSTHGDYLIYDYDYALDNNWIAPSYKEWWGFEDSKLFDFAKKELLKISKNNEPFNFTLLTADTHFYDGYVDASCDELFSTQYANSFACSDKMVGEFIEWLREQDFYDNTTIVISGDHNTMQTGFFNAPSAYNRSVYNAIINSVMPVNNNKNRQFSTMDMFPTTLAAMGADIEGDKLGLGVNLFSDKKTIYEKYGYDYVNEELQKKSDFYIQTFMKNK